MDTLRETLEKAVEEGVLSVFDDIVVQDSQEEILIEGTVESILDSESPLLDSDVIDNDKAEDVCVLVIE